MRYKVANSIFEIQDFVAGEEATSEWLRLAVHILSAEPSNNEESEEEAFLDGDGTPETDVVSVKGGYTFSGYRNHEDPAQNLVAEKQFKVGEGRKVWFKRTLPDGTAHQGLATITDVTTDGGEASAYNTFEVTIAWDRIPEKTNESGVEV